VGGRGPPEPGARAVLRRAHRGGAAGAPSSGGGSAVFPPHPGNPPLHSCDPSFDARLEEAAFAIELIDAEGGPDAPEAPALLSEALAGLAALDAALERWELRRLLAGPHDARGAVVTIQAGAGGVDAMDWAEMLERM
jgi:hypothetical protein